MIDIFKRWFSHSKEQDIDDSKNPWAGLASYEDPETAERKLKFCGRDDDSYDLTRLIIGNVFVTLYGKSGIGKTSLLNAGVFPELREERYTPMSLRLGMREEDHPQSYQTMIVEAVERVVKRTETINVIDEQQDQQSIDYLWNYFARHRFYDKYDEPTTPVIVFDQFEEVFRGYRNEAETLLRQLDYLNDKDHTLDSCEMDGQPYRYEQNFRFVVSIREDDLYRLEDSIDNCYLPALKRCRYRLRSLSEEGARDAIWIPGNKYFPEREDDCEEIIRLILGDKNHSFVRNKEDGSINTNILSLICSRIYTNFKASGEQFIKPEFVTLFIKEEPFKKFYDEATSGLSNKERSYIENNLVDDTGRRNSIPESNFLSKIPKGAKLLEGNARILQRTNTSNDGNNYRIELIHDSFCDVLNDIRKKRETRQRFYKVAFCIIAAAFGLLSFVSVIKLYQQHKNLQVLKSIFVSTLALQEIDNGDAFTATKLVLEILPPHCPYTEEAEFALRLASEQPYYALNGHKEKVNLVKFSYDGNYIVSASDSYDVKIWDVNTLKCKNLLGHHAQVQGASFSRDGNYVLSVSKDGTAIIWDAHTGDSLKEYTNSKAIHDWSMDAALSDDNKFIVVGYYGGCTRLWDFKTGACVDSLSGDGHVSKVTFSHDNKLIATSFSNGQIWIWDIINGRCIDTLFCRNNVTSIEFSNNNNYLLSASWDGQVRVWDVKSGMCHDSIQVYSCKSAYYCNDDNNIITSGSSGITIWDIATKKQLVQSKGIFQGLTLGSAAISPDGKFVASSSGNLVYLCSTSLLTFDRLLVDAEDAEYPIYSKDGNTVKFINGYHTRVWNFAEQTWAEDEEGLWNDRYHSHPIKAVSSDGKKYALAGYHSNTIEICSDGNHLTIDTIPNLVNYSVNCNSISFSNDGTMLTAGLKDGKVGIWNCDTSKSSLGFFHAHNDWVLAVAFSPNGKIVASGSRDKSIRLFSTKNGCCLGSLIGHTNSVTGLCFHPNGNLLASSSFDNSIKLWNINNSKCVNTFIGHESCVNDISFSKDGSRLVSCSSDGTIYVWNVESGKPVYKFKEDDVSKVGFSPNGNNIYMYVNSHLKIIDFPPLQELVDETRDRFKDFQLTPEERRKYYLE